MNEQRNVELTEEILNKCGWSNSSNIRALIKQTIEKAIECGEKEGRLRAEAEFFGVTKITSFQGAKNILNKFVLEQIKDKCREEGRQALIDEMLSKHKIPESMKVVPEKISTENMFSFAESYAQMISKDKFEKGRQSAIEEIINLILEHNTHKRYNHKAGAGRVDCDVVIMLKLKEMKAEKEV